MMKFAVGAEVERAVDVVDSFREDIGSQVQKTMRDAMEQLKSAESAAAAAETAAESASWSAAAVADSAELPSLLSMALTVAGRQPGGLMLDDGKYVAEAEAVRLAAEVCFQWKNPDFLFKNPDFLFKNLDFLLTNVDFIIKTGPCRCYD